MDMKTDMTHASEKEAQIAMDKTVKKKIYIILLIILAAAFVLQIIFEGFHRPGFYILFGFVGAWALILLAKKVLAPLLQKNEDYYSGGESND